MRYGRKTVMCSGNTHIFVRRMAGRFIVIADNCWMPNPNFLRHFVVCQPAFYLAMSAFFPMGFL